MNARAIFLTVCLLSSTGWGQQPNASTTAAGAAVEVANEPAHHQVLQNEYVRVFGVNVPAHRTTLMHHHANDYLSVAFGHAAVVVTSGDGKVSDVVFEDGDVRYSAGGVVHSLNNRSDTPFSNWTIELLRNQGHAVCVNNCAGDPRAKDWPPLTEKSKLIGYGDTFRITESTIEPKQLVTSDAPFPHLVIFLTDLQGHIGPAGATGDFSQKRGDIMFHGPHPEGGLTNTGEHEARMIVIEFKPIKSEAPKE